MTEQKEFYVTKRDTSRAMRIVGEMGEMNFRGNIIPHSWFQHVRRANGKPHTIAIIVLSEIVYWYRPRDVREEETGRLIGYKKRFRADKLQKSYDAMAEQFGFTKRQVKLAVKFLEDLGVITTEFRNFTVGNMKLGNVLYIEIVPERLREITHNGTPLAPPTPPEPQDAVAADPMTLQGPPYDIPESPLSHSSVPPMTLECHTNTESTTETTPQITTESTKDAAGAVSETSGLDFSLPELQLEPEPEPAPGPVSRPVSRFEGITDPLALMARCYDAQVAAGGDGDGKSWTVEPEAGGADSLGEAMLAAWLKAKGVPAGNVPDKLQARWTNTLRKMALEVPGISTPVAIRAVEVVLDRRGDNGWYNYSDPAVEKFKRDWTDAVLALLSGIDPGRSAAPEPVGFAGIRQFGRKEGWW